MLLEQALASDVCMLLLVLLLYRVVCCARALQLSTYLLPRPLQQDDVLTKRFLVHLACSSLSPLQLTTRERSVLCMACIVRRVLLWRECVPCTKLHALFGETAGPALLAAPVR
jgi:hypothetical protein